MLLRSPVSSSSPFSSPPSARSRAPCFPLFHRSISRATEVTRGSLALTAASLSQVHSYGTVDFEKKKNVDWHDLYRRIQFAPKNGTTVSRELEMWDTEERKLAKWVLVRVAKELRKYSRFEEALDVYLWMARQGDRFGITSADMAIQLDLIGKVQGPEIAEQHFSSLPKSLKDLRTYSSLLNIYKQHKLKEKAEGIFNLMCEKGYACYALTYNVMMTLYSSIGEHANVAKKLQEMMEKDIMLDNYSYNIWISNAVAMQDLNEVENAVQVMHSNNKNADWSVYTNLASSYIKFGLLDKAEVYLREAEKRITGRNRKAFFFLISVYGNIGKREELYRIWNWYKSSFDSPLNTGYRLMLHALLKLGDVAGAESTYEEWIRNRTSLDPRNAQVLMGWYRRNGFTDKAREVLDQLVQLGGKPNQFMWQILAEGFLKENRFSEAVSCLENGLSCGGEVDQPTNIPWSPKPDLVRDFLEVCKQRAQTEIADQVVSILERGGWDEIDPYKGFIQQFNLAGSD